MKSLSFATSAQGSALRADFQKVSGKISSVHYACPGLLPEMLNHLSRGHLAPRLRLSLKAELGFRHLLGCLYGNDLLCKSCLGQAVLCTASENRICQLPGLSRFQRHYSCRIERNEK